MFFFNYKNYRHMSEPIYPLFSKKFKRTYKREYYRILERPRAEDWFAQRKPITESRLSLPSSSPSHTNSTQVITLPNNTSIQGQSNPVVCELCKSDPINKVKLPACLHTFCLGCILQDTLVYNRCPICKQIINMELFNMYEGLDVSIPSYDKFVLSQAPVIISQEMLDRLKRLNDIELQPEVIYIAPEVIEEFEPQTVLNTPQQHLSTLLQTYNQQYTEYYNYYHTIFQHQHTLYNVMLYANFMSQLNSGVFFNPNR